LVKNETLKKKEGGGSKKSAEGKTVRKGRETRVCLYSKRKENLKRKVSCRE